MNEVLEKIRAASNQYLNDVLKSFIEILEIPAVNPLGGGLGEVKRAEKILNILAKYGLDKVEKIDVPDSRVEH
jgi:succinyl-diaminopimelate desuccinylase